MSGHRFDPFCSPDADYRAAERVLAELEEVSALCIDEEARAKERVARLARFRAAARATARVDYERMGIVLEAR